MKVLRSFSKRSSKVNLNLMTKKVKIIPRLEKEFLHLVWFLPLHDNP